MSRFTANDFDSIVDGWGGDTLDGLTGRLEQLSRHWTSRLENHKPFNPQETKIARAMAKRLRELGGFDFPAFH